MALRSSRLLTTSLSALATRYLEFGLQFLRAVICAALSWHTAWTNICMVPICSRRLIQQYNLYAIMLQRVSSMIRTHLPRTRHCNVNEVHPNASKIVFSLGIKALLGDGCHRHTCLLPPT